MARATAERQRASFPATVDLLRALLRRLRADRVLALAVAGIVLVTTFVFAAVPRAFNTMADDGLSWAIEHARPFARNIQMSRAGFIPAGSGDDLFGPVVAEGARFEEELPASVQEIIGGHGFVIDTPRYEVIDLPGEAGFPFPRFVTMRYQQALEEHVEVVAGTFPAARQETAELPAGLPGIQNGTPLDVPVYEIAVSPETARQIGVVVGDRLVLAPHIDDPLVRQVPRSQHLPIVVEIVGLVEPQDLGADYWLDDVAIHRAVEYDDGFIVQIYAFGVMAPDAYPQMQTRTNIPFRYNWRYFVDPDKLDAGSLTRLSSDVRRLEAEYETSVIADPDETVILTGLTTIYRRYLAQRNLSEAILSLASIGLLAVALAVIGLVATFVASRRRETVALLRGRGGTPGQLLGGQAVEGLVLALPAALIGLLLATLLVGERGSRLSLDATSLVVVLTSVLLVIAAWPQARRTLAQLERGDTGARATSPRRVMLELLIVALALVGVYLLRRRGLAGDSAAEELNEFDPFLAAVPVLLGLAVGIVTLRLYPLPIRLLGWLASLRRDLVLALGFRRVAREPGSTSLPLLVLLLAVAVGVFSSVMLTSISRGQVQTAWQRAGAEYRIEAGASGAISSSLDLAAIDGVEAVAGAWLQPDALLSTRTPTSGTMTLLAVQTRELAAVNDGTPADPHFPARMIEEARGIDIGEPTNPIPAVIGNGDLNRPLERGDTFALNLFGGEVAFIVTDVRDTFPGITVGEEFVVAPLAHVQAAARTRQLRFSDIFARAPADAFPAIEAAVEEASPASRVTSRAAEYAAVHDSPLISGVERGFRAGLVVAALYAMLAVTIALILTGQARARDLAYLRTLGLSDAQAIGLTVAEQLPAALLAVAVGIALGIAVTRLIEPGLDLTAFTGPGFPVSLQIDWLALGLLALALLGVVALAIAVTSALTRQLSMTRALRLGDE